GRHPDEHRVGVRPDGPARGRPGQRAGLRAGLVRRRSSPPPLTLDFAAMDARHISAKAERFTESVIREMNRLAVAQGAVSLAHGFPDSACPPELKRSVADAVAPALTQSPTPWAPSPP